MLQTNFIVFLALILANQLMSQMLLNFLLSIPSKMRLLFLQYTGIFLYCLLHLPVLHDCAGGLRDI